MRYINQAVKFSSASQNLITPENAANYLSVSVRTLAKWRSIGYPNIPYTKVGRCIRYKQSDLDAYLAKHTYNSMEAE
jgi:excisionase family DNA binding protein